MTEEKIWLSPPHLTGKEIDFINEAFRQNWVSPYGSNLDKFEEQLTQHFGVKGAALVNSGTAAIHLSLVLAGVGKGDEILVPTLNFAGCINPIIYQQATPLFIDSEHTTWNLDPNIVEDVLRKKALLNKLPKALVVVHLFGVPCMMDELLSLASQYEIPLIEDAADAIGTSYKKRKAGTMGQMGIISFNGNKIITTSGGGVLLSDDINLTNKAKYLSNQSRKLVPHYIHEEVGYNYMLSNILAGIGCAQIEVLDTRLAQRKQVYDYYKNSLENVNGISFLDNPDFSGPNHWLTAISINHDSVSRDAIYTHLLSRNIESRPVWNPMHLQPAFDMHPFYGGDVAENIFKNGLCLPSGSSLSRVQLERICGEIKSFIRDKESSLV